MIKLFSLKSFDWRNIQSKSCSRIKLSLLHKWIIDEFLLDNALSPERLSKHPHELLNAWIFKERRFVSLKAGCVFYRSSSWCQAIFLNLFNRLTSWIFLLSLLNSGGAFYSTFRLRQVLIFKISFKIKHLTQLQTTLSDHSQSRWRILRSYWPKSTPFSRIFQQLTIH